MLKKNWPVFLLAAALIALIGVSCYTNPGDGASHAPGLRGILAWPNGVTALGILLTLFFIAWQALLTRQAVLSSENSAKQELRAYLNVSTNTGCYQERNKEIKFEGTPILSNMGKTPAYRVRYRTNAAILKEPLAADYVLPAGRECVGDYVLGMSENYTIHIVVDDYVDPKDVADIMGGTKGRALYYWGVIEYDDVFGDPHTLEFCHRLFFAPDPKNAGTYRVTGTYMPGRNREI